MGRLPAAGAQANTFPAVLIQSGVLGVGALVFGCWSLKIRWLPVSHFAAVAAVRIRVWMRVLQLLDDKANQHRNH